MKVALLRGCWLVLLLFPLSAQAFHLKGNASYVHPRSSESGFELGLAGLEFPIPEHALEIGPRASFLQASQNGQSRHSWYIGAEGNLWWFNQFGPGLGVDWVASSSVDRDHYRIEPLMDIHLKRIGESGALSLRLGLPYEQGLQWGMRLGVTIQLGGVR